MPVDTATGVGDGRTAVPADFQLLGSFPNPFNAVARVVYRLDHPGRVELVVYTLLGQKVSTLVDGIQEAGTHTAYFEPGKYSSGVFITRLAFGGHSAVGKMVLIK